ncbi:Uncharacterized protein SCF082_LOCUS2837 [Durusdinium trenchii]|uniref:Uncharacterized protein n=1 Tax=Durusdinium trenchii TaxID=1381693 RepID=A0ABP0HQV8_9DINO
MASGYPRPCAGAPSAWNGKVDSKPAANDLDLKPELQELVLLMRKALRTVCDELRRVHKGNKILEEHHRALAGQLADCEAESDSGESGSEYFEANSPEEVLEMQQLLSRLASRYESRTSTKGSVAKACEEARCITLSWKIVFA